MHARAKSGEHSVHSRAPTRATHWFLMPISLQTMSVMVNDRPMTRSRLHGGGSRAPGQVCQRREAHAQGVHTCGMRLAAGRAGTRVGAPVELIYVNRHLFDDALHVWAQGCGEAAHPAAQCGARLTGNDRVAGRMGLPSTPPEPPLRAPAAPCLHPHPAPRYLHRAGVLHLQAEEKLELGHNDEQGSARQVARDHSIAARAGRVGGRRTAGLVASARPPAAPACRLRPAPRW